MDARGKVDEREGHVDALRKECRAGRHDGVRSAAQVAGVLDVAAQAEEHAFAGKALLVGQSARVVAADVRSVADVALALKPQSWRSFHTI